MFYCVMSFDYCANKQTNKQTNTGNIHHTPANQRFSIPSWIPGSHVATHWRPVANFQQQLQLSEHENVFFTTTKLSTAATL